MTKKKFAVSVKEVWVQVYEVDANTPEEAIQKTVSGEAKVSDGRIEYSHQLDTSTWSAEEEKSDAT